MNFGKFWWRFGEIGDVAIFGQNCSLAIELIWAISADLSMNYCVIPGQIRQMCPLLFRVTIRLQL